MLLVRRHFRKALQAAGGCRRLRCSLHRKRNPRCRAAPRPRAAPALSGRAATSVPSRPAPKASRRRPGTAARAGRSRRSRPWWMQTSTVAQRMPAARIFKFTPKDAALAARPSRLSGEVPQRRLVKEPSHQSWLEPAASCVPAATRERAKRRPWKPLEREIRRASASSAVSRTPKPCLKTMPATVASTRQQAPRRNPIPTLSPLMGHSLVPFSRLAPPIEQS